MLADDRHIEDMDLLVTFFAECTYIFYVEAMVALDKLVVSYALSGAALEVTHNHLLTALVMTLELVLAVALLALIMNVPEVDLHSRSAERVAPRS
jgi:hypothetical protein